MFNSNIVVSMKKSNLFAAALLALSAFAFVSCDDKGPVTPEEGDAIEAPFTLSADKTSIEADGVDYLTFSLTDANGVELNSTEYVSNIYVRNITTGEYLQPSAESGLYTFSTEEITENEFMAAYQGTEATNYLTITSTDPELFFHKVLINKMTSVHCVYCPNMTAGLHAVPSDVAEHMIVAGSHVTWMGTDPWSSDEIDDFGEAFGLDGIPQNIYNLRVLDGSQSGSGIARAITKQLDNYRSTSGIRIISSKLENEQLVIEAGITGDGDGVFNLACLIILDSAQYPGGSYPDEGEDTYLNVLYLWSEGAFGYDAGSAFAVSDGQEVTKTFTFDVPGLTSAEGYNACVYSIRTDGVDNAAICPIGESLDYVYKY